MGQGLTGAPGTYHKLKDMLAGPVPAPKPEKMLSEAMAEAVFAWFIDDDFAGASSVGKLFEFLQVHYFPVWHGPGSR